MLLVLSIIVFFIVRLIPGDPVTVMLGHEIPRDIIEFERERLGLNDPIIVQYLRYLKNLLHGDFGVSLNTNRPVAVEIMERYPATFTLAIGGTIVASLIGILAGIIAAINHNKLFDNLLMSLSLVFVSTPSFFFALILMLIFSLQFRLLPSIGLTSWKHAILPILTLGLRAVGFIARTTRSSMLDVIHQDYIRTSRSRGIPEKIITYSHAFRNAMIPVVTAIGLRFGGLLAGATLVETVFSIPGMGRFLVDSVGNRDYPAVQGSILVLASTFVIVNTAVDIIYGFVDPRVKYE
jgi:ABC-type dipeptide/oligopeptide/nickel transport system permease component